MLTALENYVRCQYPKSQILITGAETETLLQSFNLLCLCHTERSSSAFQSKERTYENT
jgi:hypothetical protein